MRSSRVSRSAGMSMGSGSASRFRIALIFGFVESNIVAMKNGFVLVKSDLRISATGSVARIRMMVFSSMM